MILVIRPMLLVGLKNHCVVSQSELPSDIENLNALIYYETSCFLDKEEPVYLTFDIDDNIFLRTILGFSTLLMSEFNIEFLKALSFDQ